jgi:putative molybdopterin biosynthesis protein
LEFVPLCSERYQLVIPTRHYEGKLLGPLRELMVDPLFRQAVERLPGYDIGAMGQIVAQYR